MKQIPGRHRVPLPPPVYRGYFLDIVELVESQKAHEKNIQAQIDKLSTVYYWIYCDIEAQNIRRAIVALEGEKYKLHSATNNYLFEVTKHHQRINHSDFEYPDARLEVESCLESANYRRLAIDTNIELKQKNQEFTKPALYRTLAIHRTIALNEDKQQPPHTQPRQE